MTIQWMEGFDTYPFATSTNFSGNFWNSLINSVSSGRSIQVAAARNGGYGLRIQGLQSSNYQTSRGASTGTVRTTVGWAMRQNNSFTSAFPIPGLAMTCGGVAITCVYNASGGISLFNGTILIGQSTTLYNSGTYNYIELEVYTGAGSEPVNVYVNGILEIAASFIKGGVSDIAIGRTYSGSLSGDGSNSTDFDDVIVYTDRDRLGDTAVIPLFPASDGTPNDWVASVGTDEFEMLNNVPFNNAQYISTPTLNAQSQFPLTAPPSDIFAVFGLQHTYRSQKDAALAANMQGAIILPGGAPDIAVGTDQVLTQAWNYYADVSETNPNTAAAWTPSDLDTLEIRYERTA
jgi:hypothetical protein